MYFPSRQKCRKNDKIWRENSSPKTSPTWRETEILVTFPHSSTKKVYKKKSCAVSIRFFFKVLISNFFAKIEKNRYLCYKSSQTISSTISFEGIDEFYRLIPILKIQPPEGRSFPPTRPPSIFLRKSTNTFENTSKREFIHRVWRKSLEPFLRYALTVPLPVPFVQLPVFRFSSKPRKLVCTLNLSYI